MDLYRVLQKANLSSYYDAFLSNGGDDIHQLLEATDEELHEILQVVDMANKPLHVIRLKKALNDIRSSHGMNNMNSQMSMDNSWNINAISNQGNVSFNNNNTNNNNNNNSNNHNSQSRGIPVNMLPNASLTEDEKFHIEAAAEELVKAIPEYPIKDFFPNRKKEAGLYEVIKMSNDHNSRMTAVYRYSAIYGRFNRPRKTGKAMNHHEVAVNEAAAQLCLRMPSLLSRREDLYPLARQVVKIAEESWKTQYRNRGLKRKRSAPSVMAISSEFASLHQTNPQAGFLQVQDKIEMVKNQLCDMIGQMDKLKLAFRLAKSGSGGPTTADIQKEIDALCAVQQTKISELGRYVLELRKFRNDLNLPHPAPMRMMDSKQQQQLQQQASLLTSVLPTSNLQSHQQQQQQNFNNNNGGHNVNSNNGLISLTPVQSNNNNNTANIFAATAGGLTVFPGLTQVKSDSQNATFLINNSNRPDPNQQMGSNNHLNNSNASIVTLPPGVMALNVSGGGVNNHNPTLVASNNYTPNQGASTFPNFSVFTTFGQLKAMSGGGGGGNQQQNGQQQQQGELIKIENGHPNASNVYQAYLT